MRKNKKSAIEVSTLVLYIILVATSLVLVGGVIAYSKLATKDVRKRACEWDIMKAALSKKVPDIEKFFTTGHRQTLLTNCRRDKLGDLVIRYGDVVENGIVNQDKAHKIIADEIVECWNMVGAGARDPFSNWENDDTSYCMICTTIKFDEKLQNYYIDSLSDEKIHKKRKENGVILHPIPWMVKNEYKKGESYYEFVYKSEPKFTNEELNEMEKYFITEDTIIMLKLFKYEDKDMWEAIASWGVIILGAVIFVVGLALTLTGVGAVVGIPMKVMAVIMIGGVAVSAAGGIVLTGVAIFDPVNVNPFSECEECNGVGSIKIIPPQFNLATEVKIKYPDVKGKEILEEGPYCSIIVN